MFSVNKISENSCSGEKISFWLQSLVIGRYVAIKRPKHFILASVSARSLLLWEQSPRRRSFPKLWPGPDRYVSTIADWVPITYIWTKCCDFFFLTFFTVWLCICWSWVEQVPRWGTEEEAANLSKFSESSSWLCIHVLQTVRRQSCVFA